MTLVNFNPVSTAAQNEKETDEDPSVDFTEMQEIHETAKVTYEDYLGAQQNDKRPNAEIEIEAADFVSAHPQPELYEDYEGMTGTSIFSNEEGSIAWEVDIPE